MQETNHGELNWTDRLAMCFHHRAERETARKLESEVCLRHGIPCEEKPLRRMVVSLGIAFTGSIAIAVQRK